MWRWLLHLIIVSLWVAGTHGNAHAADPSTGPTSAAEAEILWKKSQSAFDAKDYSGSLSSLERLFARYPGYPDLKDYRELRYQLGKVYFEAGENIKANKMLHSYLEGAAAHPHRLEALELIGRLQLRMKNYDEAILASIELGKTEDPAFKTRALLTKARALMKKQEMASAREIADSSKILARTTNNREIIGDSDLVGLELSTTECEKPMKSPQSENHVRAAIQEWGDCLKQSLIAFRELLNSEDTASAAQGFELMKNAYLKYGAACTNPPAPPALVVDGKPRKRNAHQLQSYHQELRENLLELFSEEKKAALSFLKNWEQENPKPSEFIVEHLKSIEESLQ